MKIFVSGSLAYDRIMDYPGRFADKIDPKRIHVLNISFVVPDLQVSFGGTAGNIAYSLSLLGIKPSVVGSIGRDGSEYLARLKKWKADTRSITIARNLPTAGAYIITDRSDNQMAGFVAGAMAYPIALPNARRGDLAIIAPGDRQMAKLARHYQKRRVEYIFDPGQAMTSLSKSDLQACIKGAKVIISNDYEINYIFKYIRYRPHPLQFVVTTLGERGSVIEYARKRYKIPAAKVKKVVDPTGAGDAYRAGFIKGLVAGYPIEKTGRLASVVASYAVEKRGTQEHRFTWRNVQERYFSNFREKL